MATTIHSGHIAADDDIAETGTDVSTIRYRPFPESTIVAETMVFGGAHDGEATAWRSIEDAQIGHARIVAAIAAGERPADLY